MNERPDQATAAWAPDPAAAILDEVLRDQETRWARGERVAVEELLQAHAELRGKAEAALELIYQEVILREEQGETPTLVEYQQRFPELAEMLRIVWEVDRFLVSRRSKMSQKEPGEKSPTRPGTRSVGRYEIQGVLGKGGMGIAYRAWDPQLKRVVALKMLRASDDADDDELARFRAEAEAIARVRHPHIVEVFDVGAEDGQPFFAMEYCAGGSLAGKLKGRPIPPREAAQLVEQIAQGVAAAHDEQIIHRDLKPGNVLLTRSDEDDSSSPKLSTKKLAPSEDGHAPSSTKRQVAQCKVTDFGLAKNLDSDDGRTRTGAIMGTPSYMAPEQAFGHTKHVGPGVDIYALGAILYECLTGSPPFRGTTVADTLDQVRNADPIPVRRLQPKTPRDLETIAMKCLRKEPAKRYASAQGLAEELNRFLEGRPIHARPVSVTERGWRWCRRNPIVTLLLFACFGAGVALLGLWASFTADLGEQRDIAQKNEKKAVAQTKLARESEQNLLDTLERLVTRVSDKKLTGVAGMEELRKEWATEVIVAFERQLRDQDDPDPSVRREAGLAYQRAAKVHFAMGQKPKREEYLQAALKVQRALVKDYPTNADYRAELGRTLLNLGLWEECRDLRLELVKERPGDIETLINLGRAYSGLGNQFRRQGHPLKGSESMELAISWFEKALQINSDDKEGLRELGRAQDNLGVHLHYQARGDEAELAFLASLATREKLAKLVKDSADSQQEIADLCTQLSAIYPFYGKPEQGLEFGNRALKIYEQLARKHRGLPIYREHLGNSYHYLGANYLELKRFTDADTLFDKSYKIYKELVQDFDGAAQYKKLLGKACCNYAVTKAKQNDFDAAETYLAEGLTVLKPLCGTDLVSATNYGGGLVQKGQILQTERADPKAARLCFEEAVAVLNQVLSQSKANPDAKMHLQRAKKGLAAK